MKGGKSPTLQSINSGHTESKINAAILLIYYLYEVNWKSH